MTNRGAETLTAWLVARGMNDATFGAKVGVHQTTVSNWCRGASIPRAEKVFEIQKVTRIKPALWFEAVDEEPTRKSKKRKAA